MRVGVRDDGGARESHRPSVAVCIPTFNQSGFLEAAIRSALDQNYAGPLEVWVADDASTDATPQLLDRLTREHSSLHRVTQPRNVGMAANATTVMREAQADFIVRLDSDDLLEPSFVDRLVGLMAEHPRAGYGHTAAIEIDADGGERRTRRVGRPTGFQSAERALRAALKGNRTVANVPIFPKRVLDRLGYYEARSEYGADYDLAIRIADVGFGNVYVDEPLVRYRVWVDSTSGRSRRKATALRGYLHIFDEVIGPAWARRGWGPREVERQRRKLAARNCPDCFGHQYSEAERRQLLELLRQLGDGPALSVRVGLCRLGFAGALERLDSLPYRLKQPIKAGLSEIRRRRAPARRPAPAGRAGG